MERCIECEHAKVVLSCVGQSVSHINLKGHCLRYKAKQLGNERAQCVDCGDEIAEMGRTIEYMQDHLNTMRRVLARINPRLDEE